MVCRPPPFPRLAPPRAHRNPDTGCRFFRCRDCGRNIGPGQANSRQDIDAGKWPGRRFCSLRPVLAGGRMDNKSFSCLPDSYGRSKRCPSPGYLEESLSGQNSGSGFGDYRRSHERNCYSNHHSPYWGGICTSGPFLFLHRNRGSIISPGKAKDGLCAHGGCWHRMHSCRGCFLFPIT